MPVTNELNESKLGTKEYWDAIYEREVENFKDIGEEGEVWFGEDSVEKMIDWTLDHIDKNASIIDVGMGNGHLCFELNRNGYLNLLGVDYSPLAVELAQSISKQREMNIDFKVMDILDESQTETIKLFSFALDKGTFDAISLAKSDPSLTSPADCYVKAIHQLLEVDGILLITSCNWTEPELRARFAPLFSFHDAIKYPVFKFGGVVGQTITTLAFKRN